MDKTALIKPFTVLLLLHLLIAFDTVEVVHGGRRGVSPHVGKKRKKKEKRGERMDKNRHREAASD